MCPVSSTGRGGNTSGQHYIEDPLIITCCGTTCCLECAGKILSNPNCPFCHANIRQKEVTVFPNLAIKRLLNGGELIQITDKLDPSMKEKIQQEEASKRIDIYRQQITSNVNRLQMASAVAAGGLENADMDDICEIGENGPQ